MWRKLLPVLRYRDAGIASEGTSAGASARIRRFPHYSQFHAYERFFMEYA
jgi:hypothetical protein